VQPIAFDMLYCALLGMGVKVLYDKGITGCMVVSGPNGDIFPIYLKDVEDEHGKVQPRLVNMHGQKAKMVYEDGIQYLAEEDYTEALKYVPNPEHYDMKKILNW
jgi:6-phosphofructokinase 1